MNKNKLSINTNCSNTLTDSVTDWEYDDQDDIYSPPLSPPPPHLIYFPENYAGNKSWQQNSNHAPQRDPYGKRSNYPEESKNTKYAGLIRRQIYTVAKISTKLIFQNNNLLLIANIVNKLWRARESFIKPALHITNNLRFIMKNGGYKNLLRYTMHFVQYHFSKQQHHHHQSSLVHNSSPATTMILVLATMSHLLVVLKKVGLKWASKTIRNMGGLDSIVMAVSAIAFAKSIQSSGRVF
ncbi:hypothetical protein INT47_001762 [Mucor saturninus]|uniref:Uncharacterized protein n=1 Tax=Mucor saturninus TaxID=64648 RepID=A0A8H7RMJ1_9FUNG|nr:hypothetical protein INT47_001762 [Mucor saturninus]